MNLIQEAARKLLQADSILAGASNGFSIAEGLHIFADNQALEDLFPDLKRKYGLRCLFQGMAAEWPSEEEKWGFWSRLVHHYYGEYKETPVMAALKKIIGQKEYFILTSNGECHFEKAGFSPERIYEIEGNWLTMQCAKGCHDTVYPAFERLEEMNAACRGGRIPSEMVPRCPVCGGPMQIHMQGDQYFIPDKEARHRLETFLAAFRGKRLVILEMGIGRRNQLIKAPLMELAEREPLASYITVNLGEIYIPSRIRDKSTGLDGDLGQILENLAGAMAEAEGFLPK